MKIKINEERALSVFKILDHGWQKQTGVFKDIVLPQDRWPLPKDPLELALFFFYAALFMRGGVISEDPFRWLYFLRQEFPGFFNPEKVSQELSPISIRDGFEDITQRVLNGTARTYTEFGPMAYKMTQHSQAWHVNSLYLVKFWGGNPLNIFRGVKNFEEAFERIDQRRNKNGGLKGMRRKIFSLLTIWLQEKGLIPDFPCPLPIDFHASRIILATKILVLENLEPFIPLEKHPQALAGKLVIRVREEMVNQIAKWSQEFLREQRITHLHINPALWVLSRDLCANHYQNSSRQKGMVYVESEQLSQDYHLWPANYKDPCSFCPIEEYCTGIVPAAPYYRWGLLARMERVPYLNPQAFLPGIDWKDFLPWPKRSRSREQNKK